MTVPATDAENEIHCCHHPPGAPYLHPAMPDALLAEYLRLTPRPLIFCGHSHRPIDRTVNGKRYVCVPPVG
jgi:diadenosine tetraphosphatase ApaH/serine/threonine PP2A family protein phosphatase